MKKGFTLVELMIVIAIIALLSGIILTSLTGSKAKSRDARRISDVNQIQLAVEQYFDRCGQYPATLTTGAGNGCPTSPSITLGSFISVIPVPPSNTASYDYVVNSSSYPTDYVIHATLEAQNAAQQNSYSNTSLTAFETNAGGNMNPTSISWNCYDPASHLLDYCVSTH